MRLEICKISGDFNPADALTKPRPLSELREMLGLVNVRLVTA